MYRLRQGTGTPVFLLHGFCGSSAGWGALIETLAERFDVIAPDWPGFGRSAGLQPCRSIAQFAGTLIALADELEVERFAVLGHSVGSFVAQQLMVSVPNRVEAAVLYGSGLRMDNTARFESAAQTVERLKAEGAGRTIERVAKTWFVDGERHGGYAECVAAGAGMTEEAGAAAITAAQPHDLSEALRTVQTPTLVIGGERERTFPPALARALADTLPRGNLCILPDCAHAAHLERPGTFNAIVRDFLQRNTAAPRTRAQSPARCGA
ncbi:alpha/beta fold hydrolase [Paraburkholderia tagetis]|uniref:Alpha/beta hydrolase n=1 Tax=Paraburkholderia tagetis TaxID=2913261 RepID=A0A9X1RLC6_9BURK|nr:alpha/beta hydrolase [Paraburkholderia tagetis]MCG5073245.1 alpha/beta hydrolase [Paraburkholderia tagetis]